MVLPPSARNAPHLSCSGSKCCPGVLKAVRPLVYWRAECSRASQTQRTIEGTAGSSPQRKTSPFVLTTGTQGSGCTNDVPPERSMRLSAPWMSPLHGETRAYMTKVLSERASARLACRTEAGSLPAVQSPRPQIDEEVAIDRRHFSRLESCGAVPGAARRLLRGRSWWGSAVCGDSTGEPFAALRKAGAEAQRGMVTQVSWGLR
jgi:hypothetical protein